MSISSAASLACASVSATMKATGSPNIAHRPLSKAEKCASEHRRSVGPLALERDAHDAELGFDEIGAGHDQRDTRHGQSCREVELADASMGVRRAQHVSVCLAVHVVVALEAAVAAQETLVLETSHRLSDSELTHRSTHSRVAEDSCSDQSLQLRTNGAGAILVLWSGAVADPWPDPTNSTSSACSRLRS